VQHLPAGNVFRLDCRRRRLGPSATGAYHLSTAFLPATPPFANLPTEQFASGVARGDFNGARLPDLSRRKRISRHISVMLGNSDGTFSRTCPTRPTCSRWRLRSASHFERTRDIACQRADQRRFHLARQWRRFVPAADQQPVGSGPWRSRSAISMGRFAGPCGGELRRWHCVDLDKQWDGTFTNGPVLQVGTDPDAIVAAKFGVTRISIWRGQRRPTIPCRF